MRFRIGLIMVAAALDPARADWERVPGFEGGRVLSLASEGATLWAGTAYGGIYRSIDSGSTWTAVNQGFSENPYLNQYYVPSLAAIGNTVYAGTGDGFFQSADRGDTWVRPSVSQADRDRIAEIAANDEFIFVSTSLDRLFRYSRATSTWTQLGSLPRGLGCMALAHGNVYGGTPLENFGGSPIGVVRSPDSGKTWQRFDNALSKSNITALAVRGGNLFAATNSKGVFRSADSGATWQAANNGLKDSLVYSLLNMDGTLFAGTGSKGVFRSDDDGATWRGVGDSASQPVYSLHAMGDALFAGTGGGGVLRSLDGGGTWTRGIAGMHNVNITALLFEGPDYVVGTEGVGVFRSFDKGATWTRNNNGLRSLNIRDLARHGEKLYASLSGIGIFRLDSRDAAWVQKGETTSSLRYSQKLATMGPALFAASDGSGIFRSPDQGETWTNASRSPPSPKSILVKDSLIFASANSVYRSSDSGKTWKAADSGLTIDPNARSYNTYQGLAAIGGNLYFEVAYTLYRSTDFAQSWVKMNNGTNADLRSFAGLGDFLYFGSNLGGVIRMTGDGKVWQDLSENGFPVASATAFALDSTHLYVGTQGFGLWKRDLSELLPVSMPNGKGSSPETRMGWRGNWLRPGEPLDVAVPAGGKVSLALFGARGEKVATLIDQSVAPGTHRIRFDGTGLPIGVYFLRLRAGSEAFGRRMVVVR